MKNAIFLLFLLFSANIGLTQNALFTPITLTGTPALSEITDITGSGEENPNKLYVAQRSGLIRVVTLGSNFTAQIRSKDFMSIPELVQDVNDERGLLGIAFHPNYPATPYIYVNYVIEGTIITRIARYTVSTSASPDTVDENSMLVLREVPGIQTNHKAGDLAFGPDGYLYITFGDGGGGGDPEDTGQDFDRFLGKIIRIDVNSTSPPNNYSIPPTNPYLPYTGGTDTLPEIWMNGVRNPWRISFDRGTGDMWIADVGQNVYEEVNMIPAGTGAGRNLGWDCREGYHNYTPSHCDTVVMPLTYPVLEYPHTCPGGNNATCGNGVSVTGGFIYRGELYPDMEGKYVCVDFGSNDVFILQQTGPGSFSIDWHAANGNSGITTFGETDNGEIFAANLNGTLYAVTMGEPLPVGWEDLTAIPFSNGNKIQWTLHNVVEVDRFELQRSFRYEFETFVSVVDVEPVPDQISYTYSDPYYNHDGIYYRVAAHMNDGSIEYSPIARILPDPVSKPSLTIDLQNGIWRLNLPSFWQNGDLIVHDIQGKLVYNANLDDLTHVDLSLPVTPGVYFVTVKGNEGSWSEKIVK